jgi:hypothetical protein
MLKSPLLQQLFIGMAIMTSMGTLVQDTKLNKAMELTVPLSNVSVNITSHLDGLNEAASSHSHIERTSVTQELAGIPRVQARDDHRRYIVSKHAPRSNAHLGDTQTV